MAGCHAGRAVWPGGLLRPRRAPRGALPYLGARVAALRGGYPRPAPPRGRRARPPGPPRPGGHRGRPGRVAEPGPDACAAPARGSGCGRPGAFFSPTACSPSRRDRTALTRARRADPLVGCAACPDPGAGHRQRVAGQHPRRRSRADPGRAADRAGRSPQRGGAYRAAGRPGGPGLAAPVVAAASSGRPGRAGSAAVRGLGRRHRAARRRPRPGRGLRAFAGGKAASRDPGRVPGGPGGPADPGRVTRHHRARGPGRLRGGRDRRRCRPVPAHHPAGWRCGRWG